MKIKEGFVLREVAGSAVVMNVGGEVSFNKMITLNESGVIIWKCIEKGLVPDAIADELCSVYEVEKETALGDVNSFIAKMKELSVIE